MRALLSMQYAGPWTCWKRKGGPDHAPSEKSPRESKNIKGGGCDPRPVCNISDVGIADIRGIRPGSLPGILLPSVESHHNAPAGKISLRAIAPVLARLLQLVAQSAEPRHSETARHIPRQGIETNGYPELFRENPELMAVRMSQNHETEQGNYGKYPEFLQSIKRGSTSRMDRRPAPGGS